MIDLEGFLRMAVCLKLPESDAKEYFLSVANLKNQITRDKFKDYMNAVQPKEWFLCPLYVSDHIIDLKA